MGYQRLTSAHEEQIKNMRKDGKSPQEVVDFFKETYQIKMPLWKVSYITGKKSEGVASDEKPRRNAAQRKYARKAATQEPLAESKASTSEEFVSHIHAAWDIHKKDFLVRVGEALATL